MTLGIEPSGAWAPGRATRRKEMRRRLPIHPGGGGQTPARTGSCIQQVTRQGSLHRVARARLPTRASAVKGVPVATLAGSAASGLCDAPRGKAEIGLACSDGQASDQAKRRWSGRRLLERGDKSGWRHASPTKRPVRNSVFGPLRRQPPCVQRAPAACPDACLRFRQNADSQPWPTPHRPRCCRTAPSPPTPRHHRIASDNRHYRK